MYPRQSTMNATRASLFTIGGEKKSSLDSAHMGEQRK
jgi:hypothetical protein